MDGITKESGGPQPDKLAVKLSGTEPTILDLKRTQSVRVVMEGTVVGHNFADHYDKDGDRTDTIKVAVVKLDDLIEIETIVRHRVPPGQQSMPVDGSGEEDPPAQGHDGELISDAEIVRELPPGAPEGVDPETGEVLGPDDDDDGGAAAELPDAEAVEGGEPDASSNGSNGASLSTEPDNELDWR